jgi:hypothetical protein
MFITFDFQEMFLKWVRARDGQVPQNAVSGGHDEGQTLYVGRARKGGDLVPGKVHPSHGCCYIPYGGEEHCMKEYEVLCNDGNCQLQWVPSSGGTVATGSIQAGVTAEGEPLFVGRTEHESTTTIGKIHPSHKCCYVAYGGKEHTHDGYEVLVCTTLPLM